MFFTPKEDEKVQKAGGTLDAPKGFSDEDIAKATQLLRDLSTHKKDGFFFIIEAESDGQQTAFQGMGSFHGVPKHRILETVIQSIEMSDGELLEHFMNRPESENRNKKV